MLLLEALMLQACYFSPENSFVQADNANNRLHLAILRT